MLKWFITPTGEKVTVEAALAGAMSEWYPLSYLKLCAEERKWTGTPSTTQLLRGARETYLMIRLPYALDPDKQAFRIVGSKGHSALEDSAGDAVGVEMFLADDHRTGIVDLVEQVNGENWLIDFKVKGSRAVSKALGLKKKKVQMTDSAGKPMVYKADGKGGKKGDPRMKTEWYSDHYLSLKNMREEMYQLNGYRLLLERRKNIKIDQMKIFYIVRDGSTGNSSKYGIYKNTYFKTVLRINDEALTGWFNDRAKELKSFLSSEGSGGPVPSLETVLKKVPPLCSAEETWDGRKCAGYCAVSEYCQKIGDNHYLGGK